MLFHTIFEYLHHSLPLSLSHVTSRPKYVNLIKLLFVFQCHTPILCAMVSMVEFCLSFMYVWYGIVFD